jgi:hypothetical protein
VMTGLHCNWAGALRAIAVNWTSLRMFLMLCKLSEMILSIILIRMRYMMNGVGLTGTGSRGTDTERSVTDWNGVADTY